MSATDIYLGAAVTVLVLFLVTAIVAYLVEVTRDAALGRAFRLHMGRNGAWKVLKTHQAMEAGIQPKEFRAHSRNPAWMWHRRPELRIVQGGKAVRFEDDEGPRAA